jgi:hypothetical protein
VTFRGSRAWSLPKRRPRNDFGVDCAGFEPRSPYLVSDLSRRVAYPLTLSPMLNRNTVTVITENRQQWNVAPGSCARPSRLQPPQTTLRRSSTCPGSKTRLVEMTPNLFIERKPSASRYLLLLSNVGATGTAASGQRLRLLRVDSRLFARDLW